MKFACGIASAAGEKVFEKGFEEFFGSDEKALEDTIKNEIADVKNLYNSMIDIFETVVHDSEIADLIFRSAGRECVYSYGAVAGRGIELLEMATKAPKVHFSEGEKTNARHLGYLEEQQEIFESSVGKATIDLYNSLLEVKGEVKLTVWFATSDGLGIVKAQYIDGIYIHQIAATDAGWQKWLLIPVSGRESLESFSGSAYWLQEIETTDYLASMTIGIGHSACRYATKGRRLQDVQWNWFIKPSAPGSDRFTIRQEESPGWVISAGGVGQHLNMDDTLPSPRAEGFEILLWGINEDRR
ncbi:hypothetical protein FAGAP_3070 [Fusarium agapanthi]|uniref:Uncharacterized protein n=1 Tax=Fusarium agapanthi TaxID=1803897 RepID=A0A9P5EGM0_9HYPO|nr:hypothetical protein FAGAP_3070 [Fusarium agapanthi]